MPEEAATVLLALVANIGLFWLTFRLATAPEVSWRELRLGAVVSAVSWQILLLLGSFIVGHTLRHSSALYGVFGVVLGLLAWLYLQAQVTLYAAEMCTGPRLAALAARAAAAADRAGRARLRAVQPGRPARSARLTGRFARCHTYRGAAKERQMDGRAQRPAEPGMRNGGASRERPAPGSLVAGHWRRG